MSTDSGIPDYRSPDSPPANPMTIRQFTSSRDYRRRYWARNHLGWRHMAAAEPNAGHRALAALEHAGRARGHRRPQADDMRDEAVVVVVFEPVELVGPITAGSDHGPSGFGPPSVFAVATTSAWPSWCTVIG